MPDVPTPLGPQRGQGMTEYLIVVALIAVAAIGTYTLFGQTIRQQTAELAARGVSLDSPTAILLGQTAAQELSFESQAVRAAGQATQQELKGRVAAVQTTAKADRLKTTTGAVASVLQSGRTIWPGLADARIGGKVLS